MKTLNQYILESFITENKNSIEHLKLPKTDYEFNWDDQYCYPFFYNVTDNVFAIGANAQELGDFHDDLFNNPDKEYVKFEDDWAKLCNVYAYNKSKDELPEDSICGRIWDLNNYAEVMNDAFGKDGNFTEEDNANIVAIAFYGKQDNEKQLAKDVLKNYCDINKNDIYVLINNNTVVKL